MDRQTSADANKQAKGAMTWSLLNTLKTNITWRELLQSMRTLLKKSGYIQIPQLSTGTLEDMILLSFYSTPSFTFSFSVFATCCGTGWIVRNRW